MFSNSLVLFCILIKFRDDVLGVELEALAALKLGPVFDEDDHILQIDPIWQLRLLPF